MARGATASGLISTRARKRALVKAAETGAGTASAGSNPFVNLALPKSKLNRFPSVKGPETSTQADPLGSNI